jgi:hypothetical protein
MRVPATSVGAALLAVNPSLRACFARIHGHRPSWLAATPDRLTVAVPENDGEARCRPWRARV